MAARAHLFTGCLEGRQGTDAHNLPLDYGHYVNRITNKSWVGD